MNCTSSIQGELIGEWKNSSPSIALYRSANDFLACIQDQAGAEIKIDSAHIKCGINGKIPHHLLIQKIKRLAKDKIKDHIAVCCYPQERPTEVWVLETTQSTALWVRKAKESLVHEAFENEETSIDCYQKALQHFDTALKIQEYQKRDTTELNSAILQLKKELFFLQIKRDLSFYLPFAKEREAFNQVVEIYKNEEDLFTALSKYLKALPPLPFRLFLSALMDEHFNRPVSAIQNYLRLADHHPDPLPCFKKAEEFVKKTIESDPFALSHFLEKLDGNRLIQLRSTTHYPDDLERLILLKDAVRMTFEKYLAALKEHSQQTETPTCFICYNDKEADVAKWLEEVFTRDFDRMGIKPLVRFRHLNPGRGNRYDYQGLIRDADRVLIACTPELKRKCDKHKENPKGVAQEIRLAKGRYGDCNKHETIFLMYLKGNHKKSCPSEFFEPIDPIKLNKSQESSIFSYYVNAFELFGGLRNVERETSRLIKEDFLRQVTKVLAGEIDQEELDEWRQARQSQVKCVLKAIQEPVTARMTHLFPPKDFTRRQEKLLQDLLADEKSKERIFKSKPILQLYAVNDLLLENDSKEINEPCVLAKNFSRDLEVRQDSWKVVEQCLKQNPLLQKDYITLATKYHNIGKSLNELGNYREALKYYRQAVRIFEKIYPSGNSNLKKARQDLITALRERIEKIKLRIEALGKTHNQAFLKTKEISQC